MFTRCDYPPGRVGPRRRVRAAGTLGSRLRTRQRAPANAWLATVANPCSSSRSASSRCAIRSALGSAGSGTRTHQQCTRRPRTSSAPASPTSHTPSEPRSITSPVRACNSRASCPTRSPSRPERGGLRSGVAAGSRLDHLRAPVRVELRDRPRVREQDRADDRRHRVQREQQRRGRHHRRHLEHGRGRPPARVQRQAPRVHPRAPVNRGGLRKGLALYQPPAIGRRRMTRSASTGSSVTWVARPSPWLTTA